MAVSLTSCEVIFSFTLSSPSAVKRCSARDVLLPGSVIQGWRPSRALTHIFQRWPWSWSRGLDACAGLDTNLLLAGLWASPGAPGEGAREVRLMVGAYWRPGAAAAHQEVQKGFTLLKASMAVPVHTTIRSGKKFKLWKQAWVQTLIRLQSNCVNMRNLFLIFSELYILSFSTAK